MTRVVFVDDHAVVRAGLRLILEREEDIDVIGEAASLLEAVNLDVDPEVIVADLILGDASGAAITTELRHRFPSAAVLVLTMVDTPSEVEAVLRAGARGYLLKEAAANDLVEAVRQVARGENYLEPSLAFSLARRPTSVVDRLSPREREVLRLVALGHTNSEIADLLTVSMRTVESHRTSIVAKLGTRSRAELVRYAFDAGIVTLDS